MPLVTTSTTATTTTMDSSSTPPYIPWDGAPDTVMPTFEPGQCLLCRKLFSSFSDSVTHMQKSHGLFIPHRQHLTVDLETLFKYLHLVIFGYHECIQCKNSKATVQAIQQHMTGKGHCRLDVSDPDSEFADFYDFSELRSDAENQSQSDVDEEHDAVYIEKPLQFAPDSIYLPSGKIIVKRTATGVHRRDGTETSAGSSRNEGRASDEKRDEEGLSSEAAEGTQITSSKREKKRERAMVKFQASNMRASDRSSLAHLSTPQQRSLLATQHQHARRMQVEEKRRRTLMDRKENKNLYGYWNTENPVYFCG